uniref:Uncharacterized protein n=1 Tax=Rhizophora mucronata TaxID=61149 RepID=A0A2P2QHX4_RHIMU
MRGRERGSPNSHLGCSLRWLRWLGFQSF